MEMRLTDVEREVLRDVLERELGDLKGEIYKTEDVDYKKVLKEREVALVSLLDKLRG
jgi:hypothetical protein